MLIRNYPVVFFPWIFIDFPLSKSAAVVPSFRPFRLAPRARWQVDSLLTRTPDGAVATKGDDIQRPEKLRRLDIEIVEEVRPTSSNDDGKKKRQKKGIECLHMGMSENVGYIPNDS